MMAIRHMNETSLDADQLAALAAVIEFGSLDAAAERLPSSRDGPVRGTPLDWSRGFGRHPHGNSMRLETYMTEYKSCPQRRTPLDPLCHSGSLDTTGR
jgi:hypothetical protein